MAFDYYLLKTEPTGYSFADLQRDSVTEWDGVSNPVALRNLREMKPGTKLIIYETGAVKSAVGTATVVSVNNDDPKNPAITIKSVDLPEPDGPISPIASPGATCRLISFRI